MKSSTPTKFAIRTAIEAIAPSILLTAILFLISFGPCHAYSHAQELASHQESFLNKYCADCHQGDTAEGGFSTDLLVSTQGSQRHGDRTKIFDQVARVIKDQRMPPEDSLQPGKTEFDRFLDWMEERSGAASSLPAVRRMNRAEYENSIRAIFELSRDGFGNPNNILRLDEYFEPSTGKLPRHIFAISYYSVAQYNRPELLEVSAPPSDLPAMHGFNNEAAVLPVSPLLAEKYIQLSREIVNSPTLPAISGRWLRTFVQNEPETASNVPEDTGVEARNKLASLMRIAFRRPVSETEINRYGTIFDERFIESQSFVESMKEAVSAILISPDFLFVFQQPPGRELSPTQRRSIVNASRLSYFLWAGPPDDQLLRRAEKGKLVTKQQMVEEAKRMLLDKKIKSLSVNFGMQWLKVNRLASSQPDIDKYPEFYKRKKQPIGIAMMIEQLLLFETIMVEDRSLLDFIDTDIAYMNVDLLNWYDLDPEVYVGAALDQAMRGDFFRVKLTGRRRGGAIVSGATLVLTSTSLRSSPVFRGAWIAETIFNQPVPPPPAAVPALDDMPSIWEGRPVTVREKLKRHRNSPSCSSCHNRIDPLGFGLEEFDAVGRFRSEYENGAAIDASGEIHGKKYSNNRDFTAVVLENKELFIRGFASHLLRYAINRELTLADEEEIKSIAIEIAANDYSFHSAVLAIVASPLFRGSPLIDEAP